MKLWRNMGIWILQMKDMSKMQFKAPPDCTFGNSNNRFLFIHREDAVTVAGMIAKSLNINLEIV